MSAISGAMAMLGPIRVAVSGVEEASLRQTVQDLATAHRDILDIPRVKQKLEGSMLGILLNKAWGQFRAKETIPGITDNYRSEKTEPLLIVHDIVQQVLGRLKDWAKSFHSA